MYWYVRCSEPVWQAYAYIMFVVILGNFILLQLFLAILIDNFGEASEDAREERKERKEKEEEEREKELERLKL